VHGDGPTAACRRPGVSAFRAADGRAECAPQAGVLRVTVAGSEELELRRLVRLLSGTEGIEVVGIRTPGRGPGAGSPGSGAALVVSLHEPTGGDVPPAQAGPAPSAPRPFPATRLPGLSRRQVDVLTGYGRSNALLETVARELGITPETLKTHLRRIRAKYAAAGRAAPTRRDLYVRAIEDGFLPPPG
jgi:DNA-binding CsgD family transcriptional regulator